MARKEGEAADLKVARRKSHMLDMRGYLATLKAQMLAMKKKLAALRKLGGKRLVKLLKKIARRKKKKAEMAEDLKRQEKESIVEDRERVKAIAKLLLVDHLFRAQNVQRRAQYVEIVELCKAAGATVLIFSDQHVSGTQLTQL